MTVVPGARGGAVAIGSAGWFERLPARRKQ